MIRPQLIAAIVHQLRLPLNGEHGIAHWARVLENGRRIARRTGARIPVVELFAVLHDACRTTDDHDPLHGPRAAELCAELRGKAFWLSDTDFALLRDACAYHADGRFDGRVTVQTCWDADRLDYGRGSTRLDARFLGTCAAREPAVIAWATERARRRAVPQLVMAEWGVPANVLWPAGRPHAEHLGSYRAADV